MSIFNALTTATAGINAQSTAFTNLSNNIANSQTVGYKASETSFQDFVSNTMGGSSKQAVSDGVGAVTTTSTQQQGTVSSSTNSLAVAISGNGFFNVSKESGQATAGKTSFSDQQYFTRNGNFYEDKNGYLVNTSGYYLDGYMADAKTGVLDTSTLTQINVSDIAFRPTETSTLTLSGGLTSGASYTSKIYDSQSNAHQLSTTWSQTSGSTGKASTWQVTVANADSTDSTMSVSPSTYDVSFDKDGNITKVTDSSGNTVGTGYTGSSATMPLTLTYTNGAASQTVDLDLGTIGSNAGATTSSANSTTPTLVSDSAESATFNSLNMESDGSVMATFSNGDTQLVGKIALSSFSNADGLMAVDGQSYVATSDSGSAKTGVVGTNGTGSLETSSVESSTTDLTSDLSNLIVTQEAYTANTKIVTTADSLLQATISMIR